MPLSAQAGLFSSLLGNEAYAQTDKVTSTSSSEKNSQTIALLQANVSSATISQDKNDKQDSKKDNQIDANATVNIVSDNAILPATGPMGVSDGIESNELTSNDVSIYVVRKGDSLSEIAKMFNVSVNTILWANDMKKGGKLVEGDTLFILPISGVKHVVTKGQTLKGIAKLYKVDI